MKFNQYYWVMLFQYKQRFCSKDRCYYHDSLLKSLSCNSNFLTWLLMGWKSHQPIQSNVRQWPSTISNVNMELRQYSSQSDGAGAMFHQMCEIISLAIISVSVTYGSHPLPHNILYFVFLSRQQQANNTNTIIGWCLFSWRPWFWPVHSIYYIHTTHYNRILTNQNKLFLRDIHTVTKVGMAVLVYWMIWYCLVSGVLSFVWSSMLYVMVWI